MANIAGMRAKQSKHGAKEMLKLAMPIGSVNAEPFSH
jgi:hypothetical protein